MHSNVSFFDKIFNQIDDDLVVSLIDNILRINEDITLEEIYIKNMKTYDYEASMEKKNYLPAKTKGLIKDNIWGSYESKMAIYKNSSGALLDNSIHRGLNDISYQYSDLELGKAS